MTQDENIEFVLSEGEYRFLSEPSEPDDEEYDEVQ